MLLENKVAIVTGAASGIGKDIATLFAREGARVVIADLNRKGAEAVAAELGGAKHAIGVAVDVTNEAQTGSCVAKTIEIFGRLDILVSNAGIQIVAPIDELEFVKWKQLLAIHLYGAFLTTRARRCGKVQGRPWRQHHLHGLGAFQRGFRTQGTLCHRQAWSNRPCQSRC
jgi:3-hydroxybutyrate dehydrogenase